MTSGNFYFKIDPSNQLFLIFATCLKVDKLAACLNGHRSIVLGLLAYRRSTIVVTPDDTSEVIQSITEEKVVISNEVQPQYVQIDVQSDSSDSSGAKTRKKGTFAIFGKVEAGKETLPQIEKS